MAWHGMAYGIALEEYNNNIYTIIQMTATNKPVPILNAKTPPSDYEFGGPIGAFLTSLILPVVTIWLAHCASIGEVYLTPTFSFFDDDNEIQQDYNEKILNVSPIKLKQSVGACIAWFVFLVVLERVLPGEVVEGAPLVTGQRLKYRLNGHLSFWITLALLALGKPSVTLLDDQGGTQMSGFVRYPIELLCDYFVEMAAALIVLSTALSVWLYLISFCDGVILAKGGNSGNVAYDFFIGRELNPRSLNGTFDWKEFCELRPGLILWFLFDVSMAIKQYQNLGYITGSMVLINIFQVRDR